MRKEEFINRVEYLLSDISSEDKIDAINYYRDYLEEAGPDKEEEVLREFGSPERIAAIIRSDLTGNMNDGGEFTENGYTDSRFNEPENNIVVSKAKSSKESEGKAKSSTTSTNKESAWTRFKNKLYNMFGDKMSKTTKTVILVLLAVILVILIFPILLGVGTFLFSVFGSVIGFLISIFFLPGIATIILFLGALIVLITCFGFLFLEGGIATILLGVTVTLVGAGLLMLVLSVLFYGKFLPFLFKKIKSLFVKEDAQ